MRLIDADAIPYAQGENGVFDDHAYRYDINELPTIEAEPVNHGRWLPQIPLGELVFFCSECKTIGSPVWKRCPVCEAKMDLEVDHAKE